MSPSDGAEQIDMSTSQRVWPDVAVPPGETLAQELAARGISQSALSRMMERPVQAINEIIRGAKAITPETALQLEQALGIPGDFWVRLEADYRYNKTRLAHKQREKQATSAAKRRLSGRLSDVAQAEAAARAQAAGRLVGRNRMKS